MSDLSMILNPQTKQNSPSPHTRRRNRKNAGEADAAETIHFTRSLSKQEAFGAPPLTGQDTGMYKHP